MLNAIKNLDLVNSAGEHQPNEFSFDEMSPGFIYHPDSIPLTIKHLWRLPELTQDEIKSGKSTLGLCFSSNKHLNPGMLIELTVFIRGEDHKFVGQVIFVKQTQHGYGLIIVLFLKKKICISL